MIRGLTLYHRSIFWTSQEQETENRNNTIFEIFAPDHAAPVAIAVILCLVLLITRLMLV